jgi:hypothetical protein
MAKEDALKRRGVFRSSDLNILNRMWHHILAA